MINSENISEEIVIVGSKVDGELTGEFALLSEQETPIRVNNGIRAAVGDVVYLMPVSNDHDDQAVGVYSQTDRLLGFVWMYQAHALRCWLESHSGSHVEARIKDVDPEVHVLTAAIERPEGLLLDARRGCDADERWARHLPDELLSDAEHSLDLCLQLLVDELTVDTQWNERLKLHIDYLLSGISLDASSYRYPQYVRVYSLMKHSVIEEVRAQSSRLLSQMVYRGSEAYTKWFAEEWLPALFRRAAESDLLTMFEVAHYTLERVESLLDEAPQHLFQYYQVNRLRFADRLCHADLSAKSYNILLTLLAVRNLMKIKLGDEQALSALSSAAADEALFHFIHPSIDEAEARLIHLEVKRLVARHAMQDICRYLSQMKAEKRLLLPMSLSPIFDELVRMGMPQTGGYSKKNFEKYYSR